MHVFLLGRDLSGVSDSDTNATRVELVHPQVSSRHLTIEVHSDGRLVLTDLNSTNGTRVNQESEPLTPGEPRTVSWSDVLYLGSFRYPLRRLQEEHLQTTVTIADKEGELSPLVIQTPGMLLTSTFPIPLIPPARTEIRPTLSLDSSEMPQAVQEHIAARQEIDATRPEIPQVNVAREKSAEIPPSAPMRRHIQRMRDTLSTELEEFGPTSNVQVLTIGRADDNDIVLPFPSISAHHACLYRTRQNLVLADLGSTNGTYVEGQRLRQPTPLQPGQRILLANHPLVVHEDLQIEIQGTQKLRIDVEKVSFSCGSQTLLDEISASFYPYEIVAVMGPSGSGKSTLLKCLAGIHAPNKGEIRYNGLPLHDHYDRFRGTIGYVPQDDLLYNELTAMQSVMYTGRIRLPRDWSLPMIRERSEQILRQLGLWEHRHKDVSQLSGGQRKRLVLAQELLTDPPLLFLDEPTSGLSARDSYMVMEILRKLADEGKSICLVIHQPSSRLFEMSDQLLLFTHNGKLAYFGPTQQSYDYFKTEANPDELLFCLEVENHTPDDWKRQYLRDDLYQHYVVERMQTPISLPSPQIDGKGRWSHALRQWGLLSQRYFRIKSKDYTNTALLLFQAPIIAGLLCLLLLRLDGRLIVSHLFDQADHITPMFVLGLAALWLGCSNSAREIVSERALYLRERLINLKLVPYLASKFTVLLVLSALQCALMLGICAPVLGFKGSFWLQWGLLVLTACCGLGLGLFLSSLVNSSASAASILPLVLLPQIIFGGYLVPTPKTDNPVVRVASTLTITRWSFASLLQSEYTGMKAKMKYKRVRLHELQHDGLLTFGCYAEHCIQSDNPRSCKSMKEILWFRDPFEEFGFASPNQQAPWWKRPLVQNAGLLLAWTVLFFVLTLIVLKRRS